MVEQAHYKVIRTIENVEVREYPELLLATVSGRGAAFLMRCNSPFMPGFLRRNEAAVELA